jgi:DNA polymerase-3 subunit beta
MLKITVEGKELKGIIEKALCNMDKKAALPILTKVILSDDGNKLTAYTSNLEGYLQVSTSKYISEGTPASVGIDEEDLKVLLKMTGDVVISETENNIMIKNGKKNISLMKYDIVDFPKFPEDIYIDSLKYSEGEFLETINNLVTFTSENENNKIMQCIHFNLTDNRIEALDGFRIGMKTIQDSEKLINDGKILVYNSIVSDLKKTLDKKSQSVIVLSQSSKYIKVVGNDFSYIQRRVDGEYFKVGNMLTDDYRLSFKASTIDMFSHIKYYADNVIASGA